MNQIKRIGINLGAGPDILVQEVSLDGDRFALIVPPDNAFAAFYGNVTNGHLSEISRNGISQDFVTFRFNGGLVEYANFRCDQETGLASYLLGYTDKAYGDTVAEIRETASAFRPCLVPLTRDGRRDETFTGANGSLFTGGWLAVTRNILGSVSTFYLGDPYGRNEVPTALDNLITSITLVESPPDKQYRRGDDPLCWWFVDGLLVCTTPLVTGTIKLFDKCGVLPTRT